MDAHGFGPAHDRHHLRANASYASCGAIYACQGLNPNRLWRAGEWFHLHSSPHGRHAKLYWTMTLMSVCPSAIDGVLVVRV